MASLGQDEEEVLSSINVTPFVDVVLVLLVILMVTSTAIVKASLQVDLPTAASGGESVVSTLNLVITRNGQLFLDGQPTTARALAKAIRRESESNPSVQAVIAADQGVAYGAVVRTIDIVKTNGVTRFALNIERVARPDDGPE